MASLTTNITTESQTTQENNYPIHLFLVRHGDRQDYDPIRGPIWKKQAEQIPQQRRKDPPLSSLGHSQARDVAVELQTRQLKYNLQASPPHIYSSPYLRCIQTATPTADLLNTSIHLENGLAECHYANNYIASPEDRFAYFPRVNVLTKSIYEPVANDDTNPPFKESFNIKECESFPLGYMHRIIEFSQVLTKSLKEQYIKQNSNGNSNGNDNTEGTMMNICFSHAASVALVGALIKCKTLPWTMAPTGIFHLVLMPNETNWTLIEENTSGTNVHCSNTSPGTFAWGFERVTGAKDVWHTLTKDLEWNKDKDKDGDGAGTETKSPILSISEQVQEQNRSEAQLEEYLSNGDKRALGMQATLMCVSQSSFDEAVLENMNDFEMDVEEAVDDASKQFKMQNLDCSKINIDYDKYVSAAI